MAKTKTFLTFSVENEMFAVDVNQVYQVIRNTDITAIPKSADYIIGIKNFRGEIITILSAQKKLNIKENAAVAKNVIVIFDLVFDDKHVAVGTIADKVHHVFEIKMSEIQAVPEFGSYFNPKYLKGVFKRNNLFFSILDVIKIFSEEEIEFIQDAARNNQIMA